MPEGRGFWETLIMCGVGVAAGLVLVAIGHSLPVYTVSFDRAMVAYQAWCSDGARVNDAAGDRYLAMMGWHYAVQNAGISLAFAAITVGLLAHALRLSTKAPFPWVRTPARRFTFVAVGVGAILCLLPGIIYGLSMDLARNQFPWCADSIGIPISGVSLAVEMLTPFLALIGALVTQRFGPLPVSLYQWDASRPLFSWAVTLVFAAAMLGGVVLWAAAIVSSDMIAPSSVIILYLLASTRAALLSPGRVDRTTSVLASETAGISPKL